MQIQYTGHHIEITPALRDFAEDKLNRLERFTKYIVNIHLTLSVDKLIQIAEARIKLAHNSEIHARSDADDMYSAIDLLIDKLMRQLTKYKEKHEEHRA